MTDTYVGRTRPWARIKDSKILEGNINTRSMLRMAELDGWMVRTVPLSDLVSPSIIVPKNQFVTVRDLPGGGEQILGAVKSRYTPLQNEEAFYWADDIIEGGGSWDTAGTFNDSTKVFGCLKIDTDLISIDKEGINDRIETYLMVSNSHDGSLPLQASVIHLRVVCQNTFVLALKQAKEIGSTFKIRHTASAEARAMVARDALNITFKNSEAFNNLANDLFAKHVTGADYTKVFNWLYPKPTDEKNKVGLTRWDKKLEMIHELRVSPTNIGINNTAWGMFNTFTERLDWFRQGEDSEASALAGSGFNLSTEVEKNRILSAVLAL